MSAGLSNTSRFVRRIWVEKLFGHYTYDLKLDSDDGRSLSKLLVLYGDNGSGKTTLLKLIFNLLASQRGRGHKTYLARVPFHQLKVELLDGTVIHARRPDDNLRGGFRMSILKRGKLLSQIDWKVDEDLNIPSQLQDAERQEHIFKTIASLNLNLYYLSDDRRISRSPDKTEGSSKAGYSQAPQVPGQLKTSAMRQYLARHKAPAPSPGLGLEAAIAQVSAWATGRALEGSTKGDADANALYADIVQHISVPTGQKSGLRARATKDKLLKELDSQASRSVAFSRYGLIRPLNVDRFVQALRSTSQSILIAVENVVSPYIESVKARLDALEPLHEAINSFCEIMNSFYRNKSISFDLQKGLSCQTLWGETIPPGVLSSGEKQLLLLFCNILVARDNQSIFIIDEPELSLNVKWQRRLVDTLVEFTNRNPIQFILATHSIELTSRHSSHVVRLDDSFKAERNHAAP
jgi:energy-coupling factor transporter ATP-binding protein EcfA2